jgi:hypothetical protein
MRRIIAMAATVIATVTAGTEASRADEYVSGYYRSNGTYVQPYMRSSPDNSVFNNYSYEGNLNPYTGQVGSNSYGDYDLSNGYSLHGGSGSRNGSLFDNSFTSTRQLFGN